MSGIPPAVVLLTADAPGLLAAFGPQWGIFDPSGAPVLVADSVASVEYDREYSVSDYPQERGAFESYNKVQVPFDAKVTLLSSLTRFELLNILEPVVASLQLVAVVTPEVSYQSANLLRYALRRTVRGGVTLIEVDVWVKEIRFSVATAQSGTPRPVGQVNGGSNIAPASATPPADFQGSGGFPAQPLNNGQPAATNTGSTNAATPTNSGPVQAQTPPSSPSPAGAPLFPILPGPL